MEELRIEIVIQVPTGIYEQAAALSEVKPLLDAFRKELDKTIVAQDGAEISVESAIVTPRPRKPAETPGTRKHVSAVP